MVLFMKEMRSMQHSLFVTYKTIEDLNLEHGNSVKINFKTGEMTNVDKGKTVQVEPFSDVQLEIYQNGGLF
jgi:3-isopropylmalate/(R)-2-methylmalate dehydratase large subunit